MTNRQYPGIVFFACLMLLISGALSAQTRDSSNAEIQKQALEMREKLNRYMADRLLTGEARHDTSGMRVFFDSLSTTLYRQQTEIEELKQRFTKLEEMVGNGTLNNTRDAKVKKAANGLYDAGAVAIGHEAISDRQLNLYFAFDEYRLSEEQKEVLKKFLKGKKISRVRVSGYTDWRGTEQHNTKLAWNRSRSVVRILNQMIIHYEILEKGDCATSNEHTPEKAQWCRRVEVMIR